jgi:hypothetical protein
MSNVFEQLFEYEIDKMREQQVRTWSSSSENVQDWEQLCASIGLRITDQDRRWYLETYGVKE